MKLHISQALSKPPCDKAMLNWEESQSILNSARQRASEIVAEAEQTRKEEAASLRQKFSVLLTELHLAAAADAANWRKQLIAESATDLQELIIDSVRTIVGTELTLNTSSLLQRIYQTLNAFAKEHPASVTVHPTQQRSIADLLNSPKLYGLGIRLETDPLLSAHDARIGVQDAVIVLDIEHHLQKLATVVSAAEFACLCDQ